ncbi:MULTISPECIES: YbaN family protein [Pseudomonas]|uniref:Inner membrane protein n=1 Tax=Pseudomonas folii TaxID=2762593 RepID=A0ABR7B5Q0_9PSED|nr:MULTISPECIES: YbaN family protein [Pseudomonas]MBC3952513.1 YbaN family protein [Pseudomonas folii]
MAQASPRTSRNRFVRYAFLGVGWTSVVLGVIGIFLPIMPTTPFLLLAAACFARSSPRFYNWLVNHKRLGPWIRGYLEGNGIPLKGKVYAIVTMWISIGFSCYLVSFIWARVFMVACAVLVTVYILRQKTLHKA